MEETTAWSTPTTARDVVELLTAWLDVDEPLVEAVGDTLARLQRLDSQELARAIVVTVIDVLDGHLRSQEGTGEGVSVGVPGPQGDGKAL